MNLTNHVQIRCYSYKTVYVGACHVENNQKREITQKTLMECSPPSTVSDVVTVAKLVADFDVKPYWIQIKILCLFKN